VGKDGFAPPTLYTCNPLGCSLATPGAALCAVLPPPPEAAAAPAGHRASADHRARRLLLHLLPPPDGPVCYCCMVTPAGGAPRWCTTLLHQQPALPMVAVDLSLQ